MDGLGISIITLAASSGAFVLGTQVGPVFLHPRMMHAIARWVRFNRHGRFNPQIRGEILAREKASHPAEISVEATGHANGTNGRMDNVKGTPERSDTAHMHTIAAEDLKPDYPAWVQVQLCLVFLLMWLASILITVYVGKWRGIVSFALVMSPLGAWLRFQLSRLNLRYDAFPIGTFMANMLGTAVLGMLLALQYTPGKTLLQCQVIQGIEDGFCGTLTTVSTFIVELKKLERKHAYVYALVSWGVGQLLMLVILGSVQFARQDGLMIGRCAIR